MSLNNQNPIDPQIGKLTTRTERYETQSGEMIEIKWTEKIEFKDGFLNKEEIFEADKLADDRIPRSIEEICRCHICLGLFKEEKVYQCEDCGDDVCKKCSVKIEKNEIENEKEGEEKKEVQLQ